MDRRVRKTREALYSAFVSLIVEKGFDTVTVQDIVDAADVGRTTFYAHFTSKDELLMFGFQRLRDELHALLEGSGDKGSWSSVEPLLRHAKAHAGLYLALLNGKGGKLAEREFQSIVEELVATELGGIGTDRIAVAMVSGALLGAVQAWIDVGTMESLSGVITTFRKVADAVRSG